MSDLTANLSMPFLMPAQAQKHVTHNEALLILDAVVQLAVEGRSLDTPPASPEAGCKYIVPVGAAGLWSGQAHSVAVFCENAWMFYPPAKGWQAYVMDEDTVVTFRDGEWGDNSTATMKVAELGVNAAPDGVNRLSVAADAVLLSHAGSDHQLKINKAATIDIASVLFQDNWMGRAEMGLVGNSNFSIKLSSDGSSWGTALKLDAADGLMTGSAVQASVDDATIGKLLRVGGFGIGDVAGGVAAPGDDADLCIAAGFFSFSAAGTNCPVADPSSGSLISLRGGNLSARQIFVSGDGQQMWVRGQSGAVWQPWVEMMTRSDMVGTVAQTGGQPTGAVVESGANANGEFTRWADGTQICTNGNSAIAADPAAFVGSVTSIDGNKMRIGRWF